MVPFPASSRGKLSSLAETSIVSVSTTATSGTDEPSDGTSCAKVFDGPGNATWNDVSAARLSDTRSAASRPAVAA